MIVFLDPSGFEMNSVKIRGLRTSLHKTSLIRRTLQFSNEDMWHHRIFLKYSKLSILHPNVLQNFLLVRFPDSGGHAQHGSSHIREDSQGCRNSGHEDPELLPPDIEAQFITHKNVNSMFITFQHSLPHLR